MFANILKTVNCMYTLNGWIASWIECELLYLNKAVKIYFKTLKKKSILKSWKVKQINLAVYQVGVITTKRKQLF